MNDIIISNGYKRNIEKEELGLKLLRHYRENEPVTIIYRRDRFNKSVQGLIIQVDLINKEIHLSNNTKICFKYIVEIKK